MVDEGKEQGCRQTARSILWALDVICRRKGNEEQLPCTASVTANCRMLLGGNTDICEDFQYALLELKVLEAHR